MVTKSIRNSETMEMGVRRAIKLLEDLKGMVFQISLLVFLISGLSELFMLQFRDLRVIGKVDIKGGIAFVLAGLGGVVTLSFVLLIFVHFLKGRTKRLRALQVKVVSAFMKALDDSPLKSNAVDREHGEQLHSQ